MGWEPFGSVHGLLRCNINAGVNALARRKRVTQRCHNSPDGKRGYRVRVTSRTGSAWRIWGILKKSVSWVEFYLGRRRLAFACSRKPCGGCRTRWRGWADGKARIERMCISLPYVESFNSKVIKGFVPEPRSRKCFFLCFEIPMFYAYMLWTFFFFLCFGIPMFYVYMLWTFYVRFTHIRIMGMVQYKALLRHSNSFESSK